MSHYDTLATVPVGQLTVVVDKTWEDARLEDSFDGTVHDLKKLAQDIDMAKLEWFTLRVRVMYEDIELASEYLGECLYENPEDVLTDGIALGMQQIALAKAKQRVAELAQKLTEISDNFEGA